MAHLFGHPSVYPSGSIRPLVAAGHLLRWYRSVDGASTDKAKFTVAHYRAGVTDRLWSVEDWLLSGSLTNNGGQKERRSSLPNYAK